MSMGVGTATLMDRRVVDAQASAALKEAWPWIYVGLQVTAFLTIILALHWWIMEHWLAFFTWPREFVWAAAVVIFLGGSGFGAWFWHDRADDQDE